MKIKLNTIYTLIIYKYIHLYKYCIKYNFVYKNTFVHIQVELCITIAYEILGVPTKRRAYDSVDPTFDDTVPTVCQESKDDFFEVFGQVFEDNSR